MKKFFILFLTAAFVANAQNPHPAPVDAKAWMIQYFHIPPDAEIDKFGADQYGAYIHWSTTINGEYHGHFRAYDFEKQAVTQIMDN